MAPSVERHPVPPCRRKREHNGMREPADGAPTARATRRVPSVLGKRGVTGGALGAVSLSRQNGSNSTAIPLKTHFPVLCSGVEEGRETIAAKPRSSSAPPA